MSVALALLAGGQLGGCQLANPAFDQPDGGADGGTEGNADTQSSTTMSTTGDGDPGDGDGDPGDGDPGDGDGDPGDGDPGDGDPGDGDPGDGDGDGGMEAIEADLAMAACVVETHPGLWPRVGDPSKFDGGQCPAEFGMHVRVVGIVNGDWLASPCPTGCNLNCDLQKQLRIGADGLPSGLGVLIPPVNFNQQMPWIGCYYVEAEGLIGEEPGGCYYGSLSAHTDEGPQSPMLFNANRDKWGLTPGAATHYGDWQPPIVNQEDPGCACDQLQQVECCPGQMVVPKQFMIGNVPVLPGETMQVNIGGTLFSFYAAQAQGGTNCEIDPEVSWALWDL
jgi:hypothetical protein